MASLLFRLGSFAAGRAWAVVVAWTVILGITVGAFFAFGGTLSNSFDIPGTASGAVTDELATLRASVQSLADTVRQHDAQIRRLSRD